MQGEKTELIMISHMKVDLKKVNTSLNTLQSDVSTLQNDVIDLQSSSGSSSYVEDNITKSDSINSVVDPYDIDISRIKKENTFIFNDADSTRENAFFLPKSIDVPIDTVITFIRHVNCTTNVNIFLKNGDFLFGGKTYVTSNYINFPGKTRTQYYASYVFIDGVGFCIFKRSPVGWIYVSGSNVNFSQLV